MKMQRKIFQIKTQKYCIIFLFNYCIFWGTIIARIFFFFFKSVEIIEEA